VASTPRFLNPLSYFKAAGLGYADLGETVPNRASEDY